MKSYLAPRGLLFTGALLGSLLLSYTPASADTVAYYRFADGTAGASAPVALDSSGNAHHMNAVENPRYSGDVPVSPIPLTGVANSFSADLTGGNHRYAGTADDGLSQVAFNDFTLEAWVRHAAISGPQTYIGRDDQAGQGGGVWTTSGHALVYFQKGNNNQFRVEVVTNDGRLLPLDSGVGPQAGVWYHVAAVGNSQNGTLSIYVDGVLRASRSDYSGLAVPQGPASPWSVGRGQWNGNPADFMNGHLDEIRISSTALSPAQFLNYAGEKIEIVQQPAGRIAWAGEDVTFSSNAVFVGNGSLAYQWQLSTNDGVSWQDITGATSPSYTIVNAGVSLDRNLYRVRFSGGSLSEFSNTVLLRVGAATPPAPQSVVAHYRFEDGTPEGTAFGATDSSGNGRNLSVTGSPIYRSMVPATRLPQTGQTNALSVDFGTGANQWAFTGTSGDSLSQVVFDSFTLETWVNFNDPAGWQTIVGRDDSGNPGQGAGPQSLLYLSSSGAGGMNNGFRIEVVTRSNTNLAVNTSQPVLANTWYHVAAVGDAAAGTLSLYVNGQLLGSAPGFDGLFIPSPGTPWTIGRGQYAGSPGDWLNGRVDEVRFSNAALSPVAFMNFHHAVLHFYAEPVDQLAAVGESITFTALAGGGGTDPLTYQWQLSQNGGQTWTNISGATAASYTVSSAQVTHHGNQYRVVATRGGVSAQSRAAVLSVPDYPAPVIVQGLTQGHLAFEGDAFTYSVQATGLGNLSYQWQKNGVNLPGQTGTTLQFSVLTRSDEGTYSVIITDDAALADGLEPASVTVSSVLAVAPHLRGAVSLNFVGAGSANWGSTAELGIILPHEVAGAVPVANWNNSASLNWISVSPAPLPLVNDIGGTTAMTATWDAANTWSARSPTGAPTTKNPRERLYHGFIERRAEDASETPAVVTITGIPYQTYDVYVYPMSVEGAPGTVIRNVRMQDAGGVRELYMRAFTGDPAPEQIPVILSHATTLQEAINGQPATVFRFAGASGSTVTLRHYDNDEHGWGWNAGGFAAVAIVDTTATAPARPTLVSRPTPIAMPAGSTAVFSVAAAPANPGGTLSYQWQRNGTNLAGANGPTLSIGNVTSGHNGNYTLVVTETSSLGTSVNRASAQLVVADDARRVLLSADMHFTAPDVEHLEMVGHGILRLNGPVTVDPNTASSNPHQIGEGTTIWNRLALGQQNRTYHNLVDADGLLLGGVTFSVAGATDAEDSATGGAIDEQGNTSLPLLRDYIFTQENDEMTLTLGGLTPFAGREVTLVVYALGKESTTFAGTRNDVATVTLAAQNSPSGQPQPAVTDQVEGRDLRYNNQAHAIFNAVVAANGTLSWTVGPVPGQPGLNAFNGFQVLLTDLGESLVSPVSSWRLTHFGTLENSGDAAFTADPDGDGFINLLEYALGANPTVAGDAIGAVTSEVVGGFLTLTFDHIDDPALTYAIEATSELGAVWSVVHTYPSFTASGIVTYTDTVPVGSSARRFLRLKVTIAE
jgi:hypothetical protein